VFLDDSAVEREEVKANAPEVTVVPLPEDPARFAEMLGRLWCFDATGVTAEDGARTELVSDEARRRKLQEQAGGLEAFLASLELAVEVRAPSERDLPRVAQLTQKTNQFNLSLKRRSLPEVQETQSSSAILILGARDRLGDYGLVGVAIFECNEDRLLVDTFLMSCRALGRGVEDALLSALFEAARRAGCAAVVAPFREGPRNQQTKAFFLRAGFADSNGTFSMPVAKAPSPPRHLRLSLTIDDRPAARGVLTA
jgi:FkbH-like protein